MTKLSTKHLLHYALIFLIVYGKYFSTAFVLKPSLASKKLEISKTTIFGITEWRDNVFYNVTSMTKSICCLPFPLEEGLLQGQTKELRLYEERFLELFDVAMNQHEGVVGMALINEQEGGILSAMPICEISAYNKMGGEFGIFLTIQCVGRGKILGITNSEGEPYMMAECLETVDEGSFDIPTCSLVADRIEEVIETLSILEGDLNSCLKEKQKEGKLPAYVNFRKNSDILDDDDDPLPNRLERYQEAYQQALETDTQGYIAPTSTVDGDELNVKQRSAQELTAVSWAALSTETEDQFDGLYRVQALDSNKLLDRLKISLHILTQKCKLVEDVLAKNKGDSGNNDEEVV